MERMKLCEQSISVLLNKKLLIILLTVVGRFDNELSMNRMRDWKACSICTLCTY